MAPDQPSSPPPARRRREPGGRNAGRHVVRTNQHEEDELQRKAAEVGTTVPKFLIDAALGTVPQVNAKVAVDALLGIRRQLLGEANNLNQLAQLGNSGGRWEGELSETLYGVKGTISNIDSWLRKA